MKKDLIVLGRRYCVGASYSWGEREGTKICALGILSEKGPRDRAHTEGKRDVRKLPERNEETSSVFEQRERRRGRKKSEIPLQISLGPSVAGGEYEDHQPTNSFS